MAYCNKCGTQLSDGAKFCPKCGNPNDDTTYNDTAEERVSTSKKPLIITLVVLIIFALLGGGWYYLRGQNSEDTIQIENKETQNEKLQEGGKLFLENFYSKADKLSWEDLEVYVRKNITKNALQDLIDGYDYECPEENCLALWMFFYEAGGDLDSLINRSIDPVSSNTYLVTSTWGYSDNSYPSSDYRVRLGVVKEGETFKIDNIENVTEEERERERASNKQNTETSTVSSESINAQQEFNSEAMKRVNEIQQIMTEMNNIYNQYVSVSSSSGSNQNLGVNAVSSISDLRLKGDKLFRELISLARKAGKSNELNAFQQEMNDFDRKAQKMERTITQDMYSY